METRGWRMVGLLLLLPSPHSHLGTLPHPNLNQLSTSPPLQEGVSRCALKSWGERASSLELSAAAVLSQYQMCSDISVLSPSLLPFLHHAPPL